MSRISSATINYIMNYLVDIDFCIVEQIAENLIWLKNIEKSAGDSGVHISIFDDCIFIEGMFIPRVSATWVSSKFIYLDDPDFITKLNDDLKSRRCFDDI